MAPLAAPEPINTTTNHSKIRVSITLPKEHVVAGRYVTGKMEVECKSDKLGIGIIMVELFGFQELTSRDHSARMTFLHSQRFFQGPSLPPSNAVYEYALPGDPELPEDYYKAKRGHSTFLFRIPLPPSSPASINFANGLARVRYEVRGSVGIYWKDLKQLVTDKDEVSVLESYDESDAFGFGPASRAKAEEGAVVVGENGRFWMHGRLIGGLLVAGESACVELQVKNHSSRKNTALTLELHRLLVLPSTPATSTSKPPLQISDTILTVPFKGAEYTLPPGGEGVAHLVFDVPQTAKGVRGGRYEGDADEAERASEALFSIQAVVEVKVAMGLGSKDIVLALPVTIVHPDGLPELPIPAPAPAPAPQPIPPEAILYPQQTSHPHRPLPVPQQQPYIDPQTQQVWIPPLPYQYYPPPDAAYFPPSPHVPIPHHHEAPAPAALYPLNQLTYTHLNVAPTRQLPPRPSSAGPLTTSAVVHGYASPPISGLPITPSDTHAHAILLPLPHTHSHPTQMQSPPRGTYQSSAQSPTTPHHRHHRHIDHASPQSAVGVVVEGRREEGQGAVASRISRHLRQTSVITGRGRSVSPVAHRFGYPPNTSAAGNAGAAGGVNVDTNTLGVDADANPLIANHQRSATTTGATAANGSGAAGDNADPILHSPRPQIRQKRSYTKLMNVEGKAVLRSDDVLELEKIAAGLESPAVREDDDRGKGKGKAKATTGDGDGDVDVNINKTLPVPPPATKPRHYKPLTTDTTSLSTVPLESLFAPPSPSPQDISGVLPPTPTLVAHKRPSKLGVAAVYGVGGGRGGGGGGGRRGGGGTGKENGLDALERRLLEQVGTRKVDNERRRDVRDVLSPHTASASPRTRSPALPALPRRHSGPSNTANTNTNTKSNPQRIPSPNMHRRTTPIIASSSPAGNLHRRNESSSGVPSTSTTPNPNYTQSGSSERIPDESAISSLTLDNQSRDSGGGGGRMSDERQREGEGEGEGRDVGDGGGEDGQGGVVYRERDEDEFEVELESMDGGKTHRAGKSVVGVESYFQPRRERERAGIESYLLSRLIPTTTAIATPTIAQHPPTTTTTAIAQTTGVSSGSSNKSSKKSAQNRGRVTAWLGKIDPDAPPPQEEIIPPSPSVVRPVEWDFLDADADVEGGDDNDEGYGDKEEEEQRMLGALRGVRVKVHEESRERSRPTTPLRNSIHPQVEDPTTPASSAAAAPATSPNPRSSGFMPIETIKAQRDTITKSMSRSVLRRAGGAGGGLTREATVVKESKRVMDIWAEVDDGEKRDVEEQAGGGARKTKEKEKEKPPLPFMVPGLPKTQTVRTDRKVSPPSAAIARNGVVVPKVVEPPLPAVTPFKTTTTMKPSDDKQAKARLTPSPVSYANVASRGTSPKPTHPANANVNVSKDGSQGKKNVNGKLPVFPPQQLQVQQENKYDVRSARGGRGGQVTHVASLWASVAGGNGNAGGAAKQVSGAGAGGTKKDDVPLSQPRGRTVTSPADVKRTNEPPLLVPRKSPATFGSTSPSPAGPTTERPRPQSKTPTPSSRPIPPPRQFSKSKTPPPTATTTAKSPTPNAKSPPLIAPKPTIPVVEPRTNRPPPTRGAPIPVAVSKSTSVPAMISSSLATPTLSSTASLVRPVGRGGGSGGSKTTTIAVGLPGIGRGDYKSAVVGGNGRGGAAAVGGRTAVGGGRASIGAVGGQVNGMAKSPPVVERKKSGLGVVGEREEESAEVPPRKKLSPGPDPMVSSGTKVNGGVGESEGVKKPSSSSSRDMAFGQARLRDLIKRYQGGGNA